MSDGGYLIQGKSPGIQSAKDRFRNQLSRVAGLKGKYSPHSLRYAYAQHMYQHYREDGWADKSAKAQVAMDLGHGAGRTDLYSSVYSR
ncbi:integrase domain-containing protein [Thioalkalivibrio sp. ALE20]|uniref:integrase domain-containing protein n=1 Tax=Thioalkalivibrio sp. ALE20 TaxID=545275 RepID=UPI000379E4C9|nr:integrase domain-containing protein [Thioalkalivibrio sp. ALE20]